MNKKMLSVFAVSAMMMTVAACGGNKLPSVPTSSTPVSSVETPSSTTSTETPDSSASVETPSSEESVYTPDLSKNVTLKLSVNYDKSTGMKYTEEVAYSTPNGTRIDKDTFKPVYRELQSKLNFTIEDVTPANDKSVNAFKSEWANNRVNGAELVCANVSDIVTQSVSGDTASILDLTDYMDKLPNFSKFLRENPSVETSILTSKHGDPSDFGIYYLPYFDGFDDLEKMTLLRADFVRALLDGDFDEAKWDTDATIWTKGEYEAVNGDGAYDVTVAVSMDSTDTKVIHKAAVTNIITQQNSAAVKDSKTLVKQFRDYIDARYGDQYANRSDLFLGCDASYDADEMVALMRLVRVSPRGLTGNSEMEMVPFVPREANNSRIADMYRWAGQMWGVRGVESRSGYLYIDKDGLVQDARGDEAVATMLTNLNKLYKEKLIVQNFQEQSNYGVSKGKLAASLIPGGNAKYCGFMEYDYSQTQGVWNDTDGSKAIEGYDFRPVIGAVADWDDGTEGNYFAFTESWRSVKSQAWCINADVAKDADKLDRALALADYFYSEEGHKLNSYGPEAEGYTSGTMNYQGREVPAFTQAALDQLNDAAIGAGSYTGYLRKFVGATLPIGYIKEQGMEYQCTSENAKNGLAIINKAIEVGTFKHVELKETENPFFTICPSSFVLNANQVSERTEIEKAEKAGQIHSNSGTNAFNVWDNVVLYGWNADSSWVDAAAYLDTVNNVWGVTKLETIYRLAYATMTE